MTKGWQYEILYPEHKHPHGVENTPPEETRLWVCTECQHVFVDAEIRKDMEENLWGHACKSHPCRKGQRCESHLEPYMPEINDRRQYR